MKNVTVQTRDGLELYARIVLSRRAHVSSWLIAVHGLGEHSGRHLYLQDLFADHFHLFQYDLRGHGQSTGACAYVENFSDYAEDLREIFHYLNTHHQMQNFFLFGHSMGALIAAHCLQTIIKDSEFQSNLKAIFMNAPPVGFSGVAGKFVSHAPRTVLNKLANFEMSFRLGGLVDINFLSHDTKVKEDYLADSLNHLNLHSRLLLQMVKTSREVFTRPLTPQCPAFVTVGSEDRVIDVSSLIRYFTTIEKSFTLKQFEGAFHEIHHEKEKWKAPYLEFLRTSLITCA